MRFTNVGLTGGIAAGKSSVAELWRAKGATVIDSDVLAHEALLPGTPTYAEIVRAFGEGVLNADRTINRTTLGRLVFTDEQQRLTLNAIVHPSVREKWSRALANAAGVTVVSVPLLFEVGAEADFHHTVAVGCSEVTQLARLAAKGLTEAQARARIRSQMPVQQKMDCAEFAIWNDGSRAVLARQAEVIWDKINPARSGIKEN